MTMKLLMDVHTIGAVLLPPNNAVNRNLVCKPNKGSIWLPVGKLEFQAAAKILRKGILE